MHPLSSYDAPQGWPIKDAKMTPIELTYADLVAAVDLAQENIMKHIWGAQDARSYLKYHGINNDCIAEIITKTENIRTMKYAEENKEQNPELYQGLVDKQTYDPQYFEPWEKPAQWHRGLELWQHVDTIMHLIFLGVVKSICTVTVDYLKHRGKWSAYQGIQHKLLSAVRPLGLSWCKAMPYATDKFGGYVSENYLALCRLSKWLHGCVDTLVSDIMFVEPDMPQSRWRKEENATWLRIRGEDAMGTAQDLRLRVESLMKREGGPPEIKPVKGGTVDQLQDVILSLQRLVCHTMVRQVNSHSIQRFACDIYLFLGMFDSLDSEMQNTMSPKPVKPTWLSSYNFVCLLNLPRLVTEYGPLRNLWEGGYLGEGFLRLAKPEIGMGYRKNWSVNALLRIYREKSLKQLTVVATESKDVEEEEDEEYDEWEESKQMYKRYRSVQKIGRAWKEGGPLSGIVVEQEDTGAFSFCIAVSPTQALVLTRKQEVPLKHWGLWFHQWEKTDKTIEYEADSIQHYILMLPKYSDIGGFLENQTQYAVVTSEWEELNEDGIFVHGKDAPFDYKTVP